jgi:hypothetical protein
VFRGLKKDPSFLRFGTNEDDVTWEWCVNLAIIKVHSNVEGSWTAEGRF